MADLEVLHGGDFGAASSDGDDDGSAKCRLHRLHAPD